MKVLVCVCLFVAVALAGDTYDPKYDDFDAETLANNKRLLTSYAHCFLEKGPCTAEGTTFKKIIPEALSTNCQKCTPKQRHLIRTVVKAMQEKIPDLWEELSNKEDPERKFAEDLKAFLNSQD